jgi:hypothetical protein
VVIDLIVDNSSKLILFISTAELLEIKPVYFLDGNRANKSFCGPNIKTEILLLSELLNSPGEGLDR